MQIADKKFLGTATKTLEKKDTFVFYLGLCEIKTNNWTKQACHLTCNKFHKKSRKEMILDCNFSRCRIRALRQNSLHYKLAVVKFI